MSASDAAAGDHAGSTEVDALTRATQHSHRPIELDGSGSQSASVDTAAATIPAALPNLNGGNCLQVSAQPLSQDTLMEIIRKQEEALRQMKEQMAQGQRDQQSQPPMQIEGSANVAHQAPPQPPSPLQQVEVVEVQDSSPESNGVEQNLPTDDEELLRAMDESAKSEAEKVEQEEKLRQDMNMAIKLSEEDARKKGIEVPADRDPEAAASTDPQGSKVSRLPQPEPASSAGSSASGQCQDAQGPPTASQVEELLQKAVAEQRERQLEAQEQVSAGGSKRERQPEIPPADLETLPFETPPKTRKDHFLALQARMNKVEDRQVGSTIPPTLTIKLTASGEDQLTLSGKVDELATHAMLMECLHSDELGSLVEERGFTVESMDAKHCAVKFGSDAKVDMPGQEEAVDAAMDKALDELDTSQWNPKAQAEHQLWQRTRASGFNFNANGAKGNPMASRFRRACEKDPDGLGADYKAKEGDTDEAAAFRAKWAREKYGNYREGKIKRETYTKTSWKQGQYIPIGRATRIAIQRLQLGPPWFYYDSVTKSIRILYVTEGYSEAFEQAWIKYQEWASDDVESAVTKRRRLEGRMGTQAEGPALAASAPVEDKGNAAVAGAGVDKSKTVPIEEEARTSTKRHASSKETGSGAPEPEPATKKPKRATKGQHAQAPPEPRAADSIKELMVAAKKTISKYQQCLSQCITIERSINKDPKWKWGSTDSDAQNLLADYDKMNEFLAQESNVNRLITEDLGKVRKSLGDLDFSAALQKLQTLDVMVQGLMTLSGTVQEIFAVKCSKH
ncbi:unnamed protein product [Prorocentrum cordatum]|uniref:Uncharacterized protein n=1 Tax=Prorocentrum cordatum TaxID=2364126 RepID=A0ABN9U4S2_9DINO|nr:unnamed protein product [Polarella glacialis]